MRDAYVGYAYSYPHKSAYRALTPPLPLREAWAGERKDALFLYVHVPYCEMRCGFCNLFARSQPAAAEIAGYLAALRRQAEQVFEALGAATFARMAVGGGTPTLLGAAGLDAVFEIAGVGGIPVSVETSPGTAEPDALRVLRDRGVRRVSLGVQSFDERELAAIGRPERASAVAALERLRGFPVVNVDLIYGIPGQTRESWLASLRQALDFAPEELYLYPLYVRRLTGMARMRGPEEDRRRELYRAGRDFLRGRGYVQESMRMFRRPGVLDEGPVYCCQDDGMLGLGCGARSYTRDLHYSDRYAVTARGVREILADYAARTDFGRAETGMRLGPEERRRRYLIKTLLRAEGMSLREYARRFGGEEPDLQAVGEWLVRDGDRVRLTEEGLELSDAIGPLLYSAPVRERMEAFELR